MTDANASASELFEPRQDGFQIDGRVQILRAEGRPSIGPGEYTLAGWVKPDQLDGVQAFAGFFTRGSNDNNVTLRIAARGMLRHTIRLDGTDHHTDSFNHFEAGRWHHVAIRGIRSISGEIIFEVMLNAEFRSAGTDRRTQLMPPSVDLISFGAKDIKAQPGDKAIFNDRQPFAGGLTDFAIWSAWLSNAEIGMLRHGTAVGDMLPSRLSHHWGAMQPAKGENSTRAVHDMANGAGARRHLQVLEHTAQDKSDAQILPPVKEKPDDAKPAEPGRRPPSLTAPKGDYGRFLKTPSGTRRTVQVGSAGALRQAVERALPGDLIEVAPNVDITGPTLATRKNGQKDKPIVLRSKKPLGARLSTRLAIAHDHWHIIGFDMPAGRINLGASGKPKGVVLAGLRLRSNKGSAKRAIEIERGRDLMVAHCEIAHWFGAGIRVTSGDVEGLTIGRCHIHDSPPGALENGTEALCLGTGVNNRTNNGIVVDECLIENWTSDHEIVTVKSTGVRLRRLSVRGGKRCSSRIGCAHHWESCDIRTEQGLLLFDHGHVVRDTKVVAKKSAKLTFHMTAAAGDHHVDNPKKELAKQNFGGKYPHPAAQDIQFEDCDGLIKIGDGFSGDTRAARRIIIRRHKGGIKPNGKLSRDVDDDDANKAQRASRRLALRPADVGPPG